MWEAYNSREEWVASFIKCLVGFCLAVMFFLAEGNQWHDPLHAHKDIRLSASANVSQGMVNWLGGPKQVVIYGSAAFGIICCALGGIRLSQKFAKGEPAHSYFVMCPIGLGMGLMPFESAVWDGFSNSGKAILGGFGEKENNSFKDVRVNGPSDPESKDSFGGDLIDNGPKEIDG